MHPANWGQAISLGLLWLIARLPVKWALALGKGIGHVAYHVAPGRRYVVRRNLELSFPDLDPEERERWVRESFVYTGRGVAEVALAWFGGPSTDRIPCQLNGLEHLQNAMATQQPVILLSGHFCCIEMAGRMLGGQIRMAGIYKPIRKKPLLDATMRRSRERNIGAVVPRDDIRGMLRQLKLRVPVWFAGDQHIGQGFAPFFGIPTATTTGLPRLARLGKAWVLPVFYNVNAAGDGYEITFGPPLEDYPSGDTQLDVTRMNEVIEQAVREHPTQYFWVHRRFKRIAGEANPYQQRGAAGPIESPGDQSSSSIRKDS
jgi:Kdo2-lipid IVA lauroyltransferase/acyltransferase